MRVKWSILVIEMDCIVIVKKILVSVLYCRVYLRILKMKIGFYFLIEVNYFYIVFARAYFYGSKVLSLITWVVFRME